MLRTSLILVSLAFTTSAFAAGKYADLEKCYQVHGQLEEVQKDGKKITTYKSQGDVAFECNEKVVAKTKGVKSYADVKELASIVGRNSNWQSALAVYTEGSKSAPKKEVCEDSDAYRSAGLALSSPADHVHSKNAIAYFDACWSVLSKDIPDLLTAESDSYHKEHLCKYLKGKKALPKDKEALCKA